MDRKLNKSKNTGRKDDGWDGSGNPKLKWHLLPWSTLKEVVAVLQYGADEYGEGNWKKVRNGRKRYLSAAFRHIVAWESGEKLDPDTGRNHLAHAISCLLFILSKELTKRKSYE